MGRNRPVNPDYFQTETLPSLRPRAAPMFDPIGNRLMHRHNGTAPSRAKTACGVRAINRDVERVFNPDRKDHPWAKRELARKFRVAYRIC
jgi:hypothetical protein